MNCREANQIDIVDHLFLMSYQPKKIRNQSFWYLSPLREEKTPSFKVDRAKNLWYDHGIGIGGTFIDFIMEYYHCDVNDALKKVFSYYGENKQQKILQNQPFHRHKTTEINEPLVSEPAIKIIAAKQPIQSPLLCSYLKKRRIEMYVANEFCSEVSFTLNSQNFLAIGFKNSAGGYELRNEYFKASSSPKYVSYIDNKTNNLSVFEGFFDFLSYQSICQNQKQALTNFLVLNSLSFFERSLLLMEKHSNVSLYLDNDAAGKKYTSLALKRSPQFEDKSKLYCGYKDINEWILNFGKVNKQHQHRGKHL